MSEVGAVIDNVCTHVDVEVNGGYRHLSCDEFLELPLHQRMKIIMGDRARFLSIQGAIIPPRTAVDGINEIRRLNALFDLPDCLGRIQSSMVKYLVRCVQGDGPANLLRGFLETVTLKTIQTPNDLIKLSAAMIRETGTSSIIGQILRNNAHRMAREFDAN